MKRFVGFMVFMFFLVFLSACEEEITSVELLSMPEEIGVEGFSFADMKLLVTYSNQRTEEVSVSEDMLSEEDLVLLGEVGLHEIELVYEGVVVYWQVEVLDTLLNIQLNRVYEMGVSASLIEEATYEEWLENIRGEDGLGIDYALINQLGELLIGYSNGEEVNLGQVVAREMELDSQDGLLRWRYVGEEEWIDLLMVRDGRDVDFVIEDGYLKWGYVGEETMHELLAISSLMGQDGENGKELVLRVDNGYIQWKYVESEFWTNLVPLSVLEGPAGPSGPAGVGVVDAKVNSSGELILIYSNGQSVNAGLVSGGHEVVFMDGDQVLSRQLVANGYSAVAPEVLMEEGLLSYTWSQDFDQVLEDMVVYLDKEVVSYDLTLQSRLHDDLSLMVGYDEDLNLPLYEMHGYLFDGWYLDEDFEEALDFSTMPSGDLVLYAKWTPEEFLLEFESGANPISEMMMPTGWTLGNLVQPQRDGYIFGGWYMDQSYLEKADYMPASSLVLYAKWEPVTYAITYELNGGTFADTSPQSYKVGYDLLLDIPQRDEHDFVGWYNNPELEGHPIQIIEEFFKGDITLYAKWEVASLEERVYAHEFTPLSGGGKSFSVQDLPYMKEEIRNQFAYARSNYDMDKASSDSIGHYQFSQRTGELFKIEVLGKITKYTVINEQQNSYMEYRFYHSEIGEKVEELDMVFYYDSCSLDQCESGRVTYKQVGENYLFMAGQGSMKRRVMRSRPTNAMTIFEYIKEDGQARSTYVYGGGSYETKGISSDEGAYSVSVILEKEDGTTKEYNYDTREELTEGLSFYKVLNQGASREYLLGLYQIDGVISNIDFSTSLFKNLLYTNVEKPYSTSYVNSLVTEDGTLTFDQTNRPSMYHSTYGAFPGYRLSLYSSHFRGMEDLLDQMLGLETYLDVIDLYNHTDQYFQDFEEVVIDGLAIKGLEEETMDALFKDKYTLTPEQVLAKFTSDLVPSVKIQYPSLDAIELMMSGYDETMFGQVKIELYKYDLATRTYVLTEHELVYQEGTLLIEGLETYHYNEVSYGQDGGLYQVVVTYDRLGQETSGEIVYTLNDRPQVVEYFTEIKTDLSEVSIETILYQGFSGLITDVDVFLYGNELLDVTYVVDGQIVHVSGLESGRYYDIRILFDDGSQYDVSIRTASINDATSMQYYDVDEEYYVQGIVSVLDGMDGFVLKGMYGNGIYVYGLVPGIQVGDQVVLKASLKEETLFEDRVRYLEDAQLVEVVVSNQSISYSSSQTAVEILDAYEEYGITYGNHYKADLVFQYVDTYGYAYFSSSTSGETSFVLYYRDVLPSLASASQGDLYIGIPFVIKDAYYGNLRILINPID